MRKNKVSFGDIQLYNSDISEEMNNCLDKDWKQKYGLEVTDVAIGDLNLTEASMKKVNKVDEAMIFSNQSLQSGLMASATAEAMTSAAKNENGAMMGFMGMGMAQGLGGNAMGAVNQGNVQNMYNPGNQQPEPGTLFGGAAPAAEATKECPKCHAKGTGKFCSNCGAELE